MGGADLDNRPRQLSVDVGRAESVAWIWKQRNFLAKIKRLYRIALIFRGSKFSRFSQIRCHSMPSPASTVYSRKFLQRNCQKQEFAKILTHEI